MAGPVLPNDPERDRHVPPMADIADLLGGGIEVDDDSDDADVFENADGSADIREIEKPKSKVAFDANLAEHLDEFEMDKVALDLLRKIERDKESRKLRDEQYEEGIRRTGMGQDAPGGATFMGASRAVHPMLAEGCVDFAASAMRELFPPNGPARTKIEGEVTKEKIQGAKRQERYLNWQLTEQISEYCEELEQTLTQVPMGGSQYMKFWQDPAIRRIACEFVPIDDIFLPYACSDFYSAQRITHVQRLTQFVFEERVESGFYRDIEALSRETSQQPEPTKAEAASDKVEGREAGMENVDGERIVYEVSTYAEFSTDGDEELPYLISIDEQSGKVVAVYRNWEEDDRQRKRLEWIIEYGFIAWRGAYKIGLPHLIGGLSAAATGALRALLDSAHVNNLPGFLRLKGARMGGQSKNVEPGSGVEVEASAAVDDIRKLVMTLPYNQPSAVLFQLLGWLTDAAKGVVTTAEEKISEASNQMPVGTTLALIEQGAKVYSSIHARLHRSQRRAFRIIARLNAKHMMIGDQIATFGEIIATKEDFAKPLAVIPVSDPNIFSETQRYAQMQMVMGVATQLPQLHNMYAVVRRMYETSKIPDIDEILPEQKQPTELNAAAENSAVMLGSPIIAFPEQEHLAHIEVHMRFITDPMLGGSANAAQRSMQPMMEHVKQHLSFLYANTMYKLASHFAGMDIGEMLKQKGAAGQVDKLLAAASKRAHAMLTQILQPLGPVMDMVLKQIAAMQPPQPMTPEQASMQIAKMETDRKTQKDKADSALEDKALTIKQSGEQTGAQLKDKQIEYQHEDAQAKLVATGAQADQAHAADLTKHLTGLDHQQQLAEQKAVQERESQALQGIQAQQQQAHEAAQAQQASGAQMMQQAHGGAVDLTKHLTGLDHQAEQAERERLHKAQQSEQDRMHQAAQAQQSGDVDMTKHLTGLAHQEEESELSRAADLTKHFSGQEHQSSEHKQDLKAKEKSEKLKMQAAKLSAKVKQSAGGPKPKGGKK
jgi:hypothetical protein